MMLAEMYIVLRCYDIQAEITREVWTCGKSHEGSEVQVYEMPTNDSLSC